MQKYFSERKKEWAIDGKLLNLKQSYLNLLQQYVCQIFFQCGCKC